VKYRSDGCVVNQREIIYFIIICAAFNNSIAGFEINFIGRFKNQRSKEILGAALRRGQGITIEQEGKSFSKFP